MVIAHFLIPRESALRHVHRAVRRCCDVKRLVAMEGAGKSERARPFALSRRGFRCLLSARLKIHNP